MSSPTIRQSLSHAIELLVGERMEEPRLDAEVLLAHVLGISRTQVLVRLDERISPRQSREFDGLVERRLKREPVAYITGYKEFYGLDFRVTPDTLIPRPETELLIEKALELARGRTIKSLADIGTGCGAIAVALATHLPRAEVYAIDISDAALKIASENARCHGVAKRVRFVQGDLLEPIESPVDLIVANLPYVTDAEMSGLADGVRLFEPRTALGGGPEGLDYIKRLLMQAPGKLRPRGAVLLEIGPTQAEQVIEIARRAFPHAMTEMVPDLAGKDRVVVVHS